MISVDPFGWLISFLAVFAVYAEFFRSRRVQVRIVEIRTSLQLDHQTGTSTPVLSILLRNAGRPLHDVAAGIAFHPWGSPGLLTVPMSAAPMPGRDDFGRSQLASVQKGEWGYGMVAEFCIQANRLRPEQLKLLQSLKKPLEQEAAIRIYSQGFGARDMPVGSTWDQFKKRWNEFAGRINPLFQTMKRAPGSAKRYPHYPNPLRKLQAIEPVLLDFIRDLDNIDAYKAIKPGAQASIFGSSTGGKKMFG